MKFDDKDIESVAKSRISRAEGNKTNYWILGSVATIVAGAFIVRYSVGFGWILSIVGLLAFIVYMNTLSKKQNIYKAELLEEWHREHQEQKS